MCAHMCVCVTDIAAMYMCIRAVSGCRVYMSCAYVRCICVFRVHVSHACVQVPYLPAQTLASHCAHHTHPYTHPGTPVLHCTDGAEPGAPWGATLHQGSSTLLYGVPSRVPRLVHCPLEEEGLGSPQLANTSYYLPFKCLKIGWAGVESQFLDLHDTF
jgi:hypothetical protein